MAVSSAYTFSYEVDVSLPEGSTMKATARSLQEAEGALPGLAGAHPLVTIADDTITFHAQASPSRLGRTLEFVTALILPLHDWLVDRRLRRASVHRIELSAPGLCTLLERGQVVRATLEMDGAGTPVHPPRATVLLLSEANVVRTWAHVTVCT